MKFEQMQYARPDFDAARETFASLRARIAAAPDAQAQLEAFREFEALSRHISTMSTLAEIRHTVDTRDAFYEAEREFFDANSPALGEAQLDVYRALLASPFRTQLEQALGRLTFEKMEVDVKSSDPAILELMAEENALTTAYEKLYASALIEFDGRKNTVSQMSLYKQNPDRAVRKAAYEAEGAWFDAHRAELDELYDKLVKNRTAQARKLGYENFIPLGAIRMRRIGYTLEDMAAYRAQIKKDFVPVVAELKKLQYARTGVADPKFYDDASRFPAFGSLKPRKETPRPTARRRKYWPRAAKCTMPSAPRRRNLLTKCSTEACSTCSPRRARPRAATAPTWRITKRPLFSPTSTARPTTWTY